MQVFSNLKLYHNFHNNETPVSYLALEMEASLESLNYLSSSPFFQ